MRLPCFSHYPNVGNSDLEKAKYIEESEILSDFYYKPALAFEDETLENFASDNLEDEFKFVAHFKKNFKATGLNSFEFCELKCLGLEKVLNYSRHDSLEIDNEYLPNVKVEHFLINLVKDLDTFDDSFLDYLLKIFKNHPNGLKVTTVWSLKNKNGLSKVLPILQKEQSVLQYFTSEDFILLVNSFHNKVKSERLPVILKFIEDNFRNNFGILMSLGKLYFYEDKVDIAFHYFDAAHKVASESPNPFIWMAYCSEKIGSLQRSLKYFEMAIELGRKSKGFEVHIKNLTEQLLSLKARINK